MNTKNYCPFCQLAQGTSSDELITIAQEIILQDKNTTAFIACDWWPNNKGHVVVIPNEHFDNLYSISGNAMIDVQLQVQRIAKVMKEIYKCDGISTRQHNERAGNQTVFHYHVHVFPRYEGDELYLNEDNWFRASIEDRLHYANLFQEYFKGLEKI